MAEQPEIVVSGLGCVSPLGTSAAATWAAIAAGECGIAALPPEFDERLEVRIAGRVTGELNPGAVEKKDLRRMDRAILLALCAAREALEDARLSGAIGSAVDRDRIGVAIGSGIGGIHTLTEQDRIYTAKGPSRISPFFIPMTLANMAAGLVAIHHGLRGPNLCHVTACASGAHAIGESLRLLRAGEADAMVVGATEAALVDLVIAGFHNMGALSKRNAEPTRASRPFDLDRDGFVMGEGAALLVLERAEHARARGARVRAKLLGYGASSDAANMVAPDAESGGALRCMRAALADARLAPTDVDYVNAHATSTPAGDAVEAGALRELFGAHADRLAVSSTKGATGHLLGAAGALEALLSVSALEAGMLPPTLNLDRPDPDCALDHVANKARSARARVVLSNSFGFGGVNAALIFGRSDA